MIPPMGLSGCSASTGLVPLRSISVDSNTHMTQIMIFKPIEKSHQIDGDLPSQLSDLFHFIIKSAIGARMSSP